MFNTFLRLRTEIKDSKKQSNRKLMNSKIQNSVFTQKLSKSVPNFFSSVFRYCFIFILDQNSQNTTEL